MTAALYVNSRGFNVTRHSYSGSQEFSDCARKYQLHRIAGWQEKGESAAMKFGIEMEGAVTVFHQQGLDAARKRFLEGWFVYADNKELEYSKKHVSWDNLQAVGLEMIRLYAIKYPFFPYTIEDPSRAFQVNINSEVFPGTELAGIELTSYIDIIANMKRGGQGIFDMKVSSSRCPQLVGLDPQLRTYSMVTGFPSVGFLWFEICSRSLGVGDEVTLLEDGPLYLDIPKWKAGAKMFVLAKDFHIIPLVPESVYLVDTDTEIENLKAIKGQKEEDRQARLDYIQKHGIPVPVSSISRQVVECRTAQITEESREDMRKQIEQDIVRIVHASETDFFPQQSGVRWPRDHCNMCYLRGICSGDDNLRDELATRDLKGEMDAF